MNFTTLFNKESAAQPGNGYASADPAALEARQKAEQRQYEMISAKGVARESGLIDLNNTPDDNLRGTDHDKKKKESYRSTYSLLLEYQRRMDDMFNHMAEIAEKLRERARDERNQIEKNTEQMQDNADFIGKGERWIDDYKNGKPVDKEKVIEELRKRNLNVSDNLPIAVLINTHLRDELDRANDENRVLEQNNTARDKNASHYEQGADDLDKQRDNLSQDFENLKNKGLTGEDFEQAAQELLDKYDNEVINNYRREDAAFNDDIDNIHIGKRVEVSPEKTIAAQNTVDLDDMFSDEQDSNQTVSIPPKPPSFTNG